jgi:hypothetical protein
MNRKNGKDKNPSNDALTADGEATIVRLDRVRDRLEIKRQNAHADALAAQFHAAMGWKEKPKKPGGGKGKRKKKT